ncbi:MAG TPA: cytochrome c biogenesis protein [Blastocatellia bacterium]|nr:cytochrome c biogenesis protein [Blastocatellia bacterium]
MEILSVIIVVAYGLCVAQAVFNLTTKQTALDKTALVALGVAFTAQTVWLVDRGISTGRCPLVGTQETSAFLSWTLVLAYAIAQRWYRTPALKTFILPLIFVLSTIAAIAPGSPGTIANINQPGQRLLLPVHAGLIMLAYAAFFISFGAGVMYIIQERELKMKRFGTIFYRLPSLDTCDAISFKSVAVGFVFLTLGVAAGIVWSHARDGVYWHGDPIEIFSVVTWIIYLVIIQSRLTAGWGGRNAAVATIIGFMLLICSLAGLRYLDALHTG